MEFFSLMHKFHDILKCLNSEKLIHGPNRKINKILNNYFLPNDRLLDIQNAFLKSILLIVSILPKGFVYSHPFFFSLLSTQNYFNLSSILLVPALFSSCIYFYLSRYIVCTAQAPFFYYEEILRIVSKSEIISNILIGKFRKQDYAIFEFLIFSSKSIFICQFHRILEQRLLHKNHCVHI